MNAIRVYHAHILVQPFSQHFISQLTWLAAIQAQGSFWLSGRKGGHMAFAVLWLRQFHFWGLLRPLFIGLDCILDFPVRICLRIRTAHRSWTDGRLARQRRSFGIEGRVGVDECNRLKAKPRVLGDVYLSLHKGMEYIVYICVFIIRASIIT